MERKGLHLYPSPFPCAQSVMALPVTVERSLGASPALAHGLRLDVARTSTRHLKVDGPPLMATPLTTTRSPMRLGDGGVLLRKCCLRCFLRGWLGLLTKGPRRWIEHDTLSRLIPPTRHIPGVHIFHRTSFIR